MPNYGTQTGGYQTGSAASLPANASRPPPALGYNAWAEAIVADITQINILDRMVRAVEKVRERLLRCAAALDAAGIPYAVIGGNAVGAWVATIDEAAVRNTQDVDILLRRKDLDQAIAAMEAAGFVYRHAAGIDMFLDGPGTKFRDAVHVLFENEKVRPEYDVATPDVSENTRLQSFRLLTLEALVRMKLTSYRLKDQVHLLDLLGVGLIDDTWPSRFPSELASRLQQLIDNPEGLPR
jgi:hypothetical protein